MSSLSDIIIEESLPPGKTVTLSRETARGFVDRANRFQVDPEGTFLADRWASGFFNVREAEQETVPQTEEGFKVSQGPPSSGEADERHFAVRTETVRGFVNRGGRFSASGEGGNLGDRLVSDWFNFRQRAAESGAE
jgi:hypothetical protein